jgi:hypothetical protein
MLLLPPVAEGLNFNQPSLCSTKNSKKIYSHHLHSRPKRVLNEASPRGTTSGRGRTSKKTVNEDTLGIYKVVMNGRLIPSVWSQPLVAKPPW